MTMGEGFTRETRDPDRDAAAMTGMVMVKHAFTADVQAMPGMEF